MIARKSLLIMTANLTEGLLAFVSLYFISRYMGPGAYGIIGFAMGFVGLFSILSNLGFNAAHVKRISEGKDLGRCIGTYMAAKIGFTGLMAAFVIGIIFFWKNIMGRGFESLDHELAVYIILGYFIVSSIASISNDTFKARKEIAKSELPIITRAIARTCIIFFVAVSGWGTLALAFAYVFGDVIFLIFSMIFFKGYPIKKPSKEYFKNYAYFAAPLIVVVASSVIMTNLDKVLIQLFWTAEEVGYYFASFRIINFIIMIASSIGILLYPTISGYHANKDTKSIKKITFLAERYISMIVFPIVIGLVVLSEPAVRILLGSDFLPAIPIFTILPFFALFEAITAPYNYQLIGMNRPKLARNRIVIMVCINVILNIILIPKDIKILGVNLFGLGAVGAAIATVVSYIAGMIYCRLAVWKLTGKNINPRILLHLLSASCMGITLYWLSNAFLVERWYHLIGFAFIGLGIYFGILFILKEFKKEDLTFLIDVVHPRKMLDYIKSEIKEK